MIPDDLLHRTIVEAKRLLINTTILISSRRRNDAASMTVIALTGMVLALTI